MRRRRRVSIPRQQTRRSQGSGWGKQPRQLWGLLCSWSSYQRAILGPAASSDRLVAPVVRLQVNYYGLAPVAFSAVAPLSLLRLQANYYGLAHVAFSGVARPSLVRLQAKYYGLALVAFSAVAPLAR